MNNAEYFVSTWGWEQTNVTFYKVIKRTAKTVTVIEVSSKRNYSAPMEYSAVPSDETPRWAKVMRKKVKNYCFDGLNNQDFISINEYSNAYPWDGKAVEGNCLA